MIIQDLPLSVFEVIRSYFVVFSVEYNYYKRPIQNWRNFCNCARSFAEIKRFYIYYDLNLLHSCAYVTYYDKGALSGVDKSVYNSISRLFELVQSLNQQVLLHLDGPVDY
jgi:hypothetical protein